MVMIGGLGGMVISCGPCYCHGATVARHSHGAERCTASGLRNGLAEVTFREAEPNLTALLRDFGPPRKSDHPEQPFWQLQRNGVWTVQAPANLPLKTGDDIPRVGAL
jgi:hypothetical protein